MNVCGQLLKKHLSIVDFITQRTTQKTIELGSCFTQWRKSLLNSRYWTSYILEGKCHEWPNLSIQVIYLTLSWESPAAGMTHGSEAWLTFAVVTPRLKIEIWTTSEVSFACFDNAWKIRADFKMTIFANPCNSLEKQVNELVPISPFPCVELRNIVSTWATNSFLKVLHGVTFKSTVFSL